MQTTQKPSGKNKRPSDIPAQVVVKPYGAIWIWLNEKERRLEFVDCELNDISISEEMYWSVAFYLYDEGFIEAIERGEL